MVPTQRWALEGSRPTDAGGADLRQVRFTSCGFKNTRFLRSNLFGANFADLTIESADFSASNLGGATFRTSRLKECRFDDATFHDTVLAHCRPVVQGKAQCQVQYLRC